MTMQMDGAARHELRAAHCVGAQEKTRTSTTLRPQVPETCASTNSATWATCHPATITGAAVRARDVAPGRKCVNGSARRLRFHTLNSRPSLLYRQAGP